MCKAEQFVSFPARAVGLRAELARLIRGAAWLTLAHAVWLAYSLGSGWPQPWLPVGGDLLGPLICLAALLWPATLVALVRWISSVVGCTRSGRPWSRSVRGLGFAMVSMPLAFACLHYLCPAIRRAAVPRLVVGAAPVVAAIGRYEADHLAPPAQLADLVPRYLPQLPTTRMRAFPRFAYERYDAAQVERSPVRARQTWRLAIHLPSGPIWHDTLQIGSVTTRRLPASALVAGQPGLGEWRLYHLWFQYEYGWP